jgi:alpha/beta superfamily hydrolase
MSGEPVREIAGPAGRIEVSLDEPVGEVRAACVLATPHPLHGGSLRTRPVYQAAKALAGIGAAVLRFNFRGVGLSAGVHDGGPGEMEDFRTALDFMAARYPQRPLWAGGLSFGGWVAWNVALDDPRVPLLLGIALPVTHFDFSAARHSTQMKVLVHGERDELVPAREVRRLYSDLAEPKELIVIEGADHLFEGRTVELGETLQDLLRDWEP